MSNMIQDRWDSDIVTGDRKAEKPSLLGFKNTIEACKLLRKHISRRSRIAVHGDVDLDGVGCCYIVDRFLRSLGVTNVIYTINKDKVHGVEDKHVKFFNEHPVDLIIIVDSSSNDIETIKRFNCDVLVLDHHEISHSETYIKNKHEYIIVNNMIDNLDNESINYWIKEMNPNTKERIETYKAEDRMSGGLVVYELLRVYCEIYKTGSILENLMLYQWVGMTLFSDVVKLVPDRNQWYVEHTVNYMEIEPCIKVMMEQLNEYKAILDKSFILYTLVPTINKAIRAGASSEALDIVLRHPQDICNLNIYKEKQEEALNKAINQNEVYPDSYIIKDITDKDISKNYCGVIASRLSGDNHKNTVVFTMENNIATGSFRGRYSEVDYRKAFDSYDETVFAQGHKSAFGFKATLEQLPNIMGSLNTLEKVETKQYLTAGKMDEAHKGINHIDNILEFKQQGLFWRLAIANSKLSSEEQLEIITTSSEAVLKEVKGKLYVYNILGFECKSFEPIKTKYISIYAEYSNFIEVYARPYEFRK